MAEDTSERWLPVVGYEGLYEVSSHGRVWSCDRISYTRTGVAKHLKGRMRALSSSDHRYVTVGLSRDDARRSKTHRVHILVATAFLGPRPSPGHEVCHDDGNGLNNHVSNLRWDTKAANNRDKDRHGTNYEANKLTCRRGHLLLAPNLVPSVAERGGRSCLACGRAYSIIRGRTGHVDHTSPEFIVMAARYYAAIMEGVALEAA